MVRFENVGLRYSLGPEVLRDVSFQLAPHSFLVGISVMVTRIVLGRDVTTDPDAALRVQPFFSLSLTARVLENRRLAVGNVSKNYVRDQLLE